MIKQQSFEVNLFGEETYIVWDYATLEAAIIDPGMATEAECSYVDNFIAQHTLHLKAVLFTHLHIDHTLGAEHISRKYGVPMLGNKADAPLGRQRREQATMFHMPANPGPLEMDRFIDEGEVLTLGEYKVEALHVPGHSPGSLVYYIPGAGIMFSGDVLFRGSIGRTDLPGGSYAQLIAGIHKKLLTLPLATKVYPGHGPSTTLADEMRSNPFF